MRTSRTIPGLAAALSLVLAACAPPEGAPGTGADASTEDASATGDPGPSAAGGATAGELAPAPDRAAILAATERYYDALSARDWDAFAAAFWPGATLTTVWQPPGTPSDTVTFTTVPEFVRQAPLGPGSREIFEERMVSSTTLQQGALAVVWARYEARFGDPGDITEWEGRDAITLLRHAGEWRITQIAYVADE